MNDLFFIFYHIVIFFGNLVLNDTSMSYLYVLLYARAISKILFSFNFISPKFLQSSTMERMFTQYGMNTFSFALI